LVVLGALHHAQRPFPAAFADIRGPFVAKLLLNRGDTLPEIVDFGWDLA
jgi:hypothetical protein